MRVAAQAGTPEHSPGLQGADSFDLSSEGAARNSPGREPRVQVAAGESPERAAHEREAIGVNHPP